FLHDALPISRRARYVAGVTAQISLGWFNIPFYQDLHRIMDSQHSSFQFSQRALQLTSSAIREILKVTTRPQGISFAGGLQSPEGCPVEQLQQAFDRRDASLGRDAW